MQRIKRKNGNKLTKAIREDFIAKNVQEGYLWILI
jgi:hypothetical protein